MTDMLEQALAKNYLSDFEIRLNKHILPHIMSFDLMGVEVGVSPNGTTVFLEKGVKTGKIVKNEPEICYSLSSSLYSVKSKLLDTIIKIGNCEEEEVGVMYERALQHYYENVSDSKLDSLGKTIAAEFDKVIVKDIHKSAIIVDEPIDIGEMNVSNMSFVLTSLIHTRGRLPIYLDTVRGFGNHMLCSKLVYDFINENDACHNIPHIIYDGLSNENEEDEEASSGGDTSFESMMEDTPSNYNIPN